jgi:hypothetical protein
MSRPWWSLRRQPEADENDMPTLVKVPTRFDPLSREPEEFVHATPEAAAHWDERQWRDQP